MRNRTWFGVPPFDLQHKQAFLHQLITEQKTWHVLWGKNRKANRRSSFDRHAKQECS
jgi:hypothetical protein